MKTQFLRHVQQIVAKKIETIDEDIKVHKLYSHMLHCQLRHWTFSRSIIWVISLKKKRLFGVSKNCNRVAILTNYICDEDCSLLFCCFWSDILEEKKVKWTDYSYSKSDSASHEYSQYFIPFNVYKTC